MGSIVPFGADILLRVVVEVVAVVVAVEALDAVDERGAEGMGCQGCMSNFPGKNGQFVDFVVAAELVFEE